MKILLTGGRESAALALARAFHRAGHTVFMAESLRGHLSQSSRVIEKGFMLPPPRQQPNEFLTALKQVIVENKIDLLIPTGEETFYVSMGKNDFPCPVFTEPAAKLDLLYNKWEFVLNAVECELPIPSTMLVITMGDMLQAYAQWKELVIKPVYPRFEAYTLLLPTLKHALTALKYDFPWIAQGYTKGRKICAYNVCHEGKITAHAAYLSPFTTRHTKAIYFQPIHHPAIFDWVKNFVWKNQFTGQLTVDFIESSNGEIFALECKPYATGGAHLLALHPKFAEAFLDPEQECVTPLNHRAYMESFPMLAYGAANLFNVSHFMQWLKAFFTSSDSILDFKDPAPFLLQARALFSCLNLALRHKISPLEAFTYDIEWNGDR